jgi:hypothetical protein
MFRLKTQGSILVLRPTPEIQDADHLILRRSTVRIDEMEIERKTSFIKETFPTLAKLVGCTPPKSDDLVRQAIELEDLLNKFHEEIMHIQEIGITQKGEGEDNLRTLWGNYVHPFRIREGEQIVQRLRHSRPCQYLRGLGIFH